MRQKFLMHCDASLFDFKNNKEAIYASIKYEATNSNGSIFLKVIGISLPPVPLIMLNDRTKLVDQARLAVEEHAKKFLTIINGQVYYKSLEQLREPEITRNHNFNLPAFAQ